MGGDDAANVTNSWHDPTDGDGADVAGVGSVGPPGEAGGGAGALRRVVGQSDPMRYSRSRDALIGRYFFHGLPNHPRRDREWNMEQDDPLRALEQEFPIGLNVGDVELVLRSIDSYRKDKLACFDDEMECKLLGDHLSALRDRLAGLIPDDLSTTHHDLIYDGLMGEFDDFDDWDAPPMDFTLGVVEPRPQRPTRAKREAPARKARRRHR